MLQSTAINYPKDWLLGFSVTSNASRISSYRYLPQEFSPIAPINSYKSLLYMFFYPLEGMLNVVLRIGNELLEDSIFLDRIDFSFGHIVDYRLVSHNSKAQIGGCRSM